MIRENFLRNKLESGQVVMGTWSVIPSAVTADIISRTGLDFVIIDAEHGPIGFETAQQKAMACESNGVSPMFRPPNVNEADILRALDIGAHGVQVPNVEHPEQVHEIIKYAKFPPLGNRGFSPFVRAAGYTHLTAAEHVEMANRKTLIGINVEGENAIRNIQSFLKIDELDIIFIGSFDLSKAMGIPGEVEHPKLLQKMKELTDEIRSKGKNVGTITTSMEAIGRFKSYGMNYLVHFVDCEVLRNGYARAVAELKNS